MGGIFISYRREDTAWCAGRLHDYLRRDFDASSIFMDVDSIEGGEKFRAHIAKRLADADVVLVVIGPRWLGVGAENGPRRIDDPQDFVRKEVTAALEQDKDVVPVLVDDTPLPAVGALPEGMKALVDLQAERLGIDRFASDAANLVQVLERKVDRRLRRLTTRRAWVRVTAVAVIAIGAAALGYWASGWLPEEATADEQSSTFQQAVYQQATRDVLNKVKGVVTLEDGRTPVDGAVVTAIVGSSKKDGRTATGGDYVLDIGDLNPQPDDLVEIQATADQLQPARVSFYYRDSLRHRLALRR